jgi:DNA-binding MarR family transcriptional regulator
MALLQLAALLPRSPKHLLKRYGISREQMYLIFLVYHDDEDNPRILSDYARLLNISNSTLTRNIQKLEEKVILRRANLSDKPAKQVYLQLLSKGQLYALEINSTIDEAMREVDAEKLSDVVSKL